MLPGLVGIVTAKYILLESFMKKTISWLILAFALVGFSVSAQELTEEDPEYQALVSLCSAEAEGAENPDVYMKECIEIKLAELDKEPTEKSE
jgi:hypothetical protein